MAVVAIVFVFAATAEAKDRVAPTRPTADLKSGGKFYFYNVGEKVAIHYDPNVSSWQLFPRPLQTHATEITVTYVADDDTYRFQLPNGYYFWGTDRCDASSDSNARYTSFVIRDSLDFYVIQLAPGTSYYNANKYMGFDMRNQWLTVDGTTGNLFWWILPANDDSKTSGKTFVARYRLYNALVSASEIWSDDYLKHYDDLYDNPASTAAELNAAADELTSGLDLTNYLTWESDYPILFGDDPEHPWYRHSTTVLWEYQDYGFQHGAYTMTLTGTVIVDQDAVVEYNPGLGSDNWGSLEVYIDDILVRVIDNYTLGRNNWFYFDNIAPGNHYLKWVFIKPRTDFAPREGPNMQWVGVYKIPQVTVHTTAAGQLATEVLNFWPDTNHKISDVRRLKVSGPLNDQDLATIDMMPDLFELDMSEAEMKEIPADMFSRESKSSKNNLHVVKLPSNLETIGSKAFKNSYVEEIEFPASLRTIGDMAFQDSYIRKAILGDNVESIGHGAFARCYSLSEVSMPDSLTFLGKYAFRECYAMIECHYPKKLTNVPDGCFESCTSLTDLSLHEGITWVGSRAFLNASSYKAVLPSTLSGIWWRAFQNTATDSITLQEGAQIYVAAFEGCKIRNLVIPENVTIHPYAFYSNLELESVEFPTSFYSVDYLTSRYDTGNYGGFGDYESLSDYSNQSVIRDCSNLKTITLKSPTMVSGSRYTELLSGCGSPTIRVPDYLMNSAYRQDSYWYQYTVEPFPTSDIPHWTINAPLTLSGRDRFEGSPSITLNSSLEINGTTAMALDDVDLSNDAMVLSQCENIQVQDTLCMRINTNGNVWRYLSLPFNFKVSDIHPINGAHTAMYYYDGASRAANNSASGNWKRMPADTIVTAGTGFIFQTSKDETTYFYSTDDGDKQKAFGCDEFVRDLGFYDAEATANRGWNLVGNPYLCYYNLHKLNYTAPITVANSTWNSSYRRNDVTYQAYSIVDDDYAISPRQAFFVQCASTESSRMTFPLEGRQLTSTITDQTGARIDKRICAVTRRLIDITLVADGEEQGDRTRVVLNPQASLDYEPTCDASKFMAEGTSVPQLYSLDASGTQYAINERPEASGDVELGVIIPAPGTYTLAVVRNSTNEPVMLYDRELDMMVDLHEQPYTFFAKTGTTDGRFVINGSSVTQIADTNSELTGRTEMFDLQGRRVADTATPGIYVQRRNGRAQMVTVK